jgi:hypothetical protein
MLTGFWFSPDSSNPAGGGASGVAWATAVLSGTCAGAAMRGLGGGLVEMVISLSVSSPSSFQALEERSAIRLVDAGTRADTVASIDFPVLVLVIVAFELSGRLGWAMLSPSALSSWVAFPRWVKLPICAIAREPHHNPMRRIHAILFITTSLSS